jgi:xanthine dehydrogenase accessory factor
MLAAGERLAVATVIETEGSTSAGPGAKAIVDAGGRTRFGWVGGGCAETAVRDAALEALAEGRPRVIRLDLDDEVLGVGMPCGGSMRVYIEPMNAQPRLVVLGHGAIAETLCALGKLLGFHVTVNDPLATAAAFPGADVRVVDDVDYAKLDCGGESYVVVTTQHKSDFEALERALRQRPAYLGLVASRKRTALLLERLLDAGLPAFDLRAVSAPGGLDLGSRTPQEIALSIAAEILQRRSGAGTSGRPLAEVRGVEVSERGVEIPEGPEHAGKCPR